MTRLTDETAQRIAGSLERIVERQETEARRHALRSDAVRLAPFVNPHNRRPVDRLGRQEPRRLGVGMLLDAGIELGARRLDEDWSDRVRRVPARAVVDVGEDEDGLFALVLCPCEAKPIARSGLTKCPGCERWYTYHQRVYVVYGDMDPPAR
jgi:hypothetical protein